ncbi:DUF5615 family PIN-like protein [Candidatus Daviesbacteria bacterium]|nr:DUF5615 family PIN-like protein [Candidatus Daviesbacteria bacterium]
MKFLVDENLGTGVVRFLKSLNHSAEHIIGKFSGLPDTDVLNFAFKKSFIVLTTDKDFGEMVFKNKQSHCGILLFRLKDQTTENTVLALEYVLSKYGLGCEEKFIVITEKDGHFKTRDRS